MIFKIVVIFKRLISKKKNIIYSSTTFSRSVFYGTLSVNR